MSTTAKLFQFGSSQAVRIRVRLRFEGVQEVDVLDIRRSPPGEACAAQPLDA